MDLLFNKYASPFIFINGMIGTGRLSEFVDEFSNIEAEKQIWEVWLHKVIDKSFVEFKRTMLSDGSEKEQIETTVHNSKIILKNFNPEGVKC